MLPADLNLRASECCPATPPASDGPGHHRAARPSPRGRVRAAPRLRPGDRHAAWDVPERVEHGAGAPHAGGDDLAARSRARQNARYAPWRRFGHGVAAVLGQWEAAGRAEDIGAAAAGAGRPRHLAGAGHARPLIAVSRSALRGRKHAGDRRMGRYPVMPLPPGHGLARFRTDRRRLARSSVRLTSPMRGEGGCAAEAAAAVTAHPPAPRRRGSTRRSWARSLLPCRGA